jgi:hypothetical protein
MMDISRVSYLTNVAYVRDHNDDDKIIAVVHTDTKTVLWQTPDGKAPYDAVAKEVDELILKAGF